MTRLRQALAFLERLAGRRLGLVLLFVLALAVYAVRAIGWPLIVGRDLDEYLYTYIQFFDWHPLLPWPMLFRTPVPGIVDGAALDVANGFFAEPLLGVLFAGSVVAWTLAARAYSARAALLVAAALLVFPAYGLMFHELSSEPIFCAGFALWALLFVGAAERPSVRRFVWVGLGLALLALIRPGNALLIVFAAFPLFLAGSWRRRLRWCAAFVVAAIVPLLAWAVLNGVRYGDYTLARGGNAVIPFYRAFISDKIVSPDNGPASRKLANAIRQHLLTRNPYKAYGVTLHEVFASGSFRIHEDLYLLSDQVFGWNSNYSILRKAGVEAVKAHPSTYFGHVAHTIWRQLSNTYFRAPSSPARHGPAPAVSVKGRTLPAPTEGQPNPSGLDVADQIPLRHAIEPAARFHSDSEGVGFPLRESPGSHWQCTALAPPRSVVALVPALDHLDRDRRDRPSLAKAARARRARRAPVGRPPSDRRQCAGPVCRSALCTAGCAGVRVLRRVRSPRRSRPRSWRSKTRQPAIPIATTKLVTSPAGDLTPWSA